MAQAVQRFQAARGMRGRGRNKGVADSKSEVQECEGRESNSSGPAGGEIFKQFGHYTGTCINHILRMYVV